MIIIRTMDYCVYLKPTWVRAGIDKDLVIGGGSWGQD